MVFRRLRTLVLAAVLAVLTPLAAACSGPVPGPFGSSASATSVQADWQHTLQVVANVKADPPSLPVVYLLGGSVARECIPSEGSWRAAVRDAGGPAALTFDLGSRNRTTAQDLKLVAQMPDVPTILFIGVNVGRFTPASSNPTITLPQPSEPLPGWKQHAYSAPLSPSRKYALVTKWMRDRYPLFKQHYAYDLGMLEKLIKACKAKGFHPVLLDLPRNAAVIASRMDVPVGRYHRSCKALAAKYAVPWVDFVAAAKLKNADFYDLWHLLKPGRLKWQSLLAGKTAALLERYGMAVTPTPTASPSTSPSP